MTFQAYLDTIKAKTGKTPEDLRKLATAAGIITPQIKAGDLVAWLKQEFGLGHGHSMAVWNVFVTNGWVQPKQTKLKTAPKKK
jgi:hypothetical protein